jgi:hypothetical protein
MKNQSLTIYGISNDGPAYCEAIGLSKVFAAYAELNGSTDFITEGGVGFNPNSGYIYIALESGICICSCIGRDVEYLVTNFETGEETFFSSYDEAETYLVTLNA